MFVLLLLLRKDDNVSLRWARALYFAPSFVHPFELLSKEAEKRNESTGEESRREWAYSGQTKK